jgi:hypothetical protein
MIDLAIEPAAVTAGFSRVVTVRVADSDGLRTNVVVGLDVPSGLGLERGRSEFAVARLAPGEVHEHPLRIRPVHPGEFTIGVRNLSYCNEQGRSCRERGRTTRLVVEPAAEPRDPPVPTPVGERPPPAGGSIFVSYRRSDAKLMVPALVRDLGREPRLRGVDIFLDLHGIRTGEVWRDALDRELRQCTVLLALIGPGWLAGRRVADGGDLVRHEIATALRRGIAVLPVLVDAAMPAEADLPPDIRDLAGRQAFTFDLSRYRRSVEELARQIRHRLRSRAR